MKLNSSRPTSVSCKLIFSNSKLSFWANENKWISSIFKMKRRWKTLSIDYRAHMDLNVGRMWMKSEHGDTKLIRLINKSACWASRIKPKSFSLKISSPKWQRWGRIWPLRSSRPRGCRSSWPCRSSKSRPKRTFWKSTIFSYQKRLRIWLLNLNRLRPLKMLQTFTIQMKNMMKFMSPMTSCSSKQTSITSRSCSTQSSRG